MVSGPPPTVYLDHLWSNMNQDPRATGCVNITLPAWTSPSSLSTFCGFSRRSPLQVPTGKARRHRRWKKARLLQALSRARLLGERKPGFVVGFTVACLLHTEIILHCGFNYISSPLSDRAHGGKEVYKCLLPIQVRATTRQLLGTPCSFTR